MNRGICGENSEEIKIKIEKISMEEEEMEHHSWCLHLPLLSLFAALSFFSFFCVSAPWKQLPLLPFIFNSFLQPGPTRFVFINSFLLTARTAQLSPVFFLFYNSSSAPSFLLDPWTHSLIKWRLLYGPHDSCSLLFFNSLQLTWMTLSINQIYIKSN